MTMGPRERRREDVFWNLAALVDNYVLELPPTRLSPDALRPEVPVRTRVCVPMSGYERLPDAFALATETAKAGMRPVITTRMPPRNAMGALSNALADLASTGAQEIVIGLPASVAPTEALDRVAQFVTDCDLGRRGFATIGFDAASLARQRPEPSADLLRAFDAVQVAAKQADLALTMVSPTMRSVEPIIEWERSLREAGNQTPVRVRMPGIESNPFRRIVPLLLGLAAAIETDPECQILGLQFFLRGSPARTSAFAGEICQGNFVVEEGLPGYRLSLLRARKA